MIWLAWMACASPEAPWQPLVGQAFAVDDHGDDDDERIRTPGPRATAALSTGVPPVTDPTWQSECGSCHLAYSPGLLPARSWSALLTSLGDHFGEDATVDPATATALQAYAAANAADVAPYRLSASLARASTGQTPLRILDIGGLRHEHEEVPRSWVVDNPEVRSLSNCAACHPAAAAGRFDEGSIRIPGHGRFDD